MNIFKLDLKLKKKKKKVIEQKPKINSEEIGCKQIQYCNIENK